MAKFTYTAVKDGKTITGSAEAINEQALVANLSHQNIKPLVIKEQKQTGSVFRAVKSFGEKIKQKDLVLFTRQLSTMISAGVPLPRALATLEAQTNNKLFKKIIAGVSKDVESGLPLATAFSKYPAAFGEVYVNMVGAGEAGGILDDILKRMATQVEQESSMRKKIKSAMTYPTAIMFITVVAFFGVMVFVIPKLGKIIKDIGGEDAALPIYTQILLSISDFVRGNIILILAINIIGIFLLRRYIKTPSGKYVFHKLLLKIPIIKTVVLKIAVARFARTFASLMSSGVTVLDALEVTGRAMGNKVLEKELKEAAQEVKNGKQLSQPMGVSKYFPPIVAQMLAVGEETGQIDTVLVKVADFYEEEVDALIDGLSSIIEPVMIVVLGGMVGLIAASVMGPIASLSQNLAK